MVITAQSKHIKEIVKLAEKYFSESPYVKSLKFDNIQCIEFVRSALIKIQYELVVATNDKNQVIGAALAYLTDYGWSTDYKVSMEFIYVLPEYRSATTAEELISHIEEWAYKMKAKEVQLGDIGFRPDAIGKFYETLGYTDRGVCLRKVL